MIGTKHNPVDNTEVKIPELPVASMFFEDHFCIYNFDINIRCSTPMQREK